MQIKHLDHINLRTTQLDTMIDWYTEVLGMRSGERPDFKFPGAWMYVGNIAAVHLVGIEGEPGAGSETALKLEHFAFSATGGVQFQAMLDQLGINYKRVDIPDINVYQINLCDPDGNHLHVDFPAKD